jgi:aliphatic nitrilase
MIGKLASKTYQINEAIDNFIGYMREAKAAGAALVTAGEVYLPGYPNDINYTSDWATKGWPAYKRNSITVGDSNWLRLLDAARLIGIAIQFGFSEKSGNLYYMSQALIGPDGSVWNQRRKLRPSGSERNFWSDDVMKNNLRVVTTPLGRISMLMCWDHLRPQSTFDVMAQLPNVHICAWPITAETTASTPGWDRQEVAQTAASYFSQLTGAVTLLVSYGYCAVYRSSLKVAEMLPSDPANMLYYTITPRDWSGSAGSTDSEFSYGVLQLLSDNYPGQKVADPARNVLTLNPQTT